MWKLLLVDDEEILREGLRDCIDWAAEGIEIVGEAEDGLQALRKTEVLRPDIILADIVMPELNGLEFVQCLRKGGNPCHVVFLSAHQKVEYLKSALQSQAVDYLFKPVRIEELLTTMRQIVTRLSHDDRRSQVLLDLLMGRHSSSEEIQHQLEACGWSVASAYQPFLLESRLVLNQDDLDALRQELPSSWLMCRWGRTQVGGLVTGSLPKSQAEPVLASLSTPGTKDWVLGLGSVVSDLSQLPSSIDVARRANLRRFDQGWNRVYDQADLVGKWQILGDPLISQMLGELAEAVVSPQEGVLDHVLVEWEALLVAKQVFDPLTRSSLYDMALQRMAGGLDLGEGDANSLEPILQELSQQPDGDQAAGLFRRALGHLQKGYRRRLVSSGQRTVQKIKDIIRQNYHHDVSLADLADRCGLSESYMDQVFRKEASTTVHEYLTEVRLNRAKELLRDPEYRIYEVAAAVGYRDPNYFARLFKKVFDLTPGEYRGKATP